jgi:hypothetical protein
MGVKKGLEPGSVARVSSATSGDVVLQVNVPEDGPLVLRHLSPGDYIAECEGGGRAEFTVPRGLEEVQVGATLPSGIDAEPSKEVPYAPLSAEEKAQQDADVAALDAEPADDAE